MEIKIGVHNAPREIVIESEQSQADIEKTVRKALADPQGTLTLSDDRGRQVIVRTEHLAYVDIGAPIERKIGFGTT